MENEHLIDELLVETNSEKVVRMAHYLPSQVLSDLYDHNEEKFDKVVSKVAKIMKENPGLQEKIQTEGEIKNASL